jgi:hypothetical protein
MLIDESFRTAYRELEERMKALAETDGDVFLPNPEPLGTAQYILICMEPSLGHWARSVDHARSRVEAGFRNFLSSIEASILHFCARRYLCGPTDRYHITDFSKGAMLVKHAGFARTQRYDRWYSLLLQEINLCGNLNSSIVAVGKRVAEELVQRDFPRPFTSVIHYSGQAALARRAGLKGREDSFREFNGSVSLEDIVATMGDALKDAHVPPAIRNDILAQLTKTQLTTSRQQLIFNYKVAFESMRS